MSDRGAWLAAAVGLLLGVATVAIAPAARACSSPPPPAALVGAPRDGAVGVATDVIPVFNHATARLSQASFSVASFVFTPPSGPAITATARRSHVWHFEVVPQTPLLPNTRYTLTGRWPDLPVDSLSLSFTTGAGPVRMPPAPPAVAMQHYTLEGAMFDSCSVLPSGTCIAAPDGTMLEHISLDAAGQESSWDGLREIYLYDKPFWTNLTGINQGNPYTCMKFKTRADNGTLSEPVVLCAASAPRHQLRGSANLSCTASGLVHEGKRVGAPITDGGAADGGKPAGSADAAAGPAPAGGTRSGSGGCAVAPAAGSDGRGLLVLALVGGLACRWRRRAGQPPR